MVFSNDKSGCLRSIIATFTPVDENPIFGFLMQKFDFGTKESVIEKLTNMETSELLKVDEEMNEKMIPYKFNLDQEQSSKKVHFICFFSHTVFFMCTLF